MDFLDEEREKLLRMLLEERQHGLEVGLVSEPPADKDFQ
jgi:hypothetical protein